MNQRISRVIDNIKENRDFFGWIVGVAIGTVGLMGWFSTNFVTVAAGKEISEGARQADVVLGEQIKSLTEEVKESNAMLMAHMEKEKLNTVLSDIRRNEAEVFQIKQFVGANGTNAQAEARLRQLDTERSDLMMKRDCILNGNRLCN